MEAWLENPNLLAADNDAEYAAVIEIDLAEIDQPIVCAPNDPDDARLLSEVQGDKVDEVFIGSCMTNIGHFRAAGELLEAHGAPVSTRMWICPPTRMDENQLMEEHAQRCPDAHCAWATKLVLRPNQRYCPPLHVTSPIDWAKVPMSI
jgi:aconitate hydratase 2/2-methylisocitrate dehydratase